MQFGQQPGTQPPTAATQPTLAFNPTQPAFAPQAQIGQSQSTQGGAAATQPQPQLQFAPTAAPATGAAIQAPLGTGAPPLNPQPQPQAKPQKPPSLKSYRFILSKIQASLQTQNYKALDSFVRLDSNGEVIKSLAKGLMFFKPPSQGADSTRKKLFDAQNPLKWAGKDNLTSRFASDIVVKLSDILNLDEILTFDLLESYFLTNENTRKLLVYLLQVDNNITSAENDIPQQQALVGNIKALQQRLTSIDKWKKEFLEQISVIIEEVQRIYLKERTALLQAVFAILCNPGTPDRSASPCVSELLKLKVSDHLISSLEDNLAQTQTFLGFTCSLQEITSSLQKQEILISKCLQRIYTYYEVPTPSIIVKYLKYQTKTHFSGLKLRPQDFHADRILQWQSQKITGLAVQQFMTFFQIRHLVAPQPEKSDRLRKFLQAIFADSNQADATEMASIIEGLPKPLDDVSATIFLTFRQFISAVRKLDLHTAAGISDKFNKLKFNLDARTAELKNNSFIDFIVGMQDVEVQPDEDHHAGGGIISTSSELDEQQMLIQDWLNLVFCFLKENNMDYAIGKTQQLTFEILGSSQHLKHTWTSIDDSSRKDAIIGNVAALGKAGTRIYHTLDIFETILARPLDAENRERFVILMTALAGNKKTPFGPSVVNLLQSYQVRSVISERVHFDEMSEEEMFRYLASNNAAPHWNLVQALLMRFAQLTAALENGVCSSNDQSEYLQLTILFSKLVSQNYLLYAELTTEATQAMVERQEALDFLRDEFDNLDRHDRFSINRMYQNPDLQLSQPILSYFLRAFTAIIQQIDYQHNLFRNIDIGQIGAAIKSIMNALTEIYKSLDQQGSILGWIESSCNENGVPQVVEFFLFYLNEYENPNSTYPVTTAFIKFIDAVFAKDHPQMYLHPIELRTNIQDTCLQKFLIQGYQPLIANFTQLSFNSMKDFLALYTRLLKFTNRLLKRFDDVLPQMKAGLCHRYPQYDDLLRIIHEMLNQETIEHTIINALMLEEEVLKSGLPSGLTNKFWLQQLKTGAHLEDSKMRIKVQKMITSALSCLNTLVGLAFQQSQLLNLTSEQLAQQSSRAFYLSSLQSVTSIGNIVKYPGQWEQYTLQTCQSTVQYSLFNIIQYYVNPHRHLCPYISTVQVEAIRFFTSCCQLWATQPLGQRVSLESTLRTMSISSEELRLKYVMNLKASTSQIGSILPLIYLAGLLDLLIVASTTQAQFVVELFREQEFTQIFIEHLVKRSVTDEVRKSNRDNEKDPSMKILSQTIESKVIILLSEMSASKICEPLLRKLADGDDFTRIFNLSVARLLDVALQKLDIEFKGEQQTTKPLQKIVDNDNQISTMKVFSNCQALITVKYFMRLLSEEYQKDVSQPNVLKAIREFYDNPKTIQVISMTISGQPYLKDMLAVNDEMQTFSDRSLELLRNLQQTIESSDRLTSAQKDLLRNVSNKLLTSDDCPVFLTNLDGANLSSFLRKGQHLYSAIQTSNPFKTSENSKIGSQFTINVPEFIATARTYFYDDEGLLAVVRRAACQYNLALSYLFSYQQFVLGHRDFILSIGRIRMRENLRRKDLVINNRAFCTSLFNVVDVDSDISALVKNAARAQGTQSRLAKVLIDIARPLARRLVTGSASEKLKPIIGSTFLKQAVEPDTISISFELSQNEIDLDFLSILLGALNSLGELEDFQIDILKILDTEIITNLIKGLPKIRHTQVQDLYRRDTTQQIKLENERKAAKLFMNLVLQIFSISIQVQNKIASQPLRLDAPATVVQQSSEMDYLQIISQVTKIMQEGSSASSPGYSYFIEGLKIIEEAFSLVSVDSMSRFMKKQETAPLKIIIQKYLSSQSTIQEKVKIVEFLTNYSRTENGAEHLHSENILKHLAISGLTEHMNSTDFYETIENGETRRNPVHMLWCQVLLLIRSLNHALLSADAIEYQRSLGTQISYFWSRLQALLEFGMHLKLGEFGGSDKAISLALFEELELITGVVQQYMDNADKLQALDFEKYAGIKDRVLFGVLHLFTINRPSAYSSSTEQYLQKMTHPQIPFGVLRPQNFTGLDLALDVQKVKMFYNTITGILNTCLINENRIGGEDLLNTWDPIRDPRQATDTRRTAKSQTYMLLTATGQDGEGGLNEFDQYRSLSQLSQASLNLLDSLTNMQETFKLWLGCEHTLDQLHSSIQGVFRNDEWIRTEYQGMSSYFVAHSLGEVLELFEQALQMGYLAAALLLQKLRETFDTAEQAGYVSVYGVGGGAYNTITGQREQISIKRIMDFGDQIVTKQRALENELKKAVAGGGPKTVVKPSTQSEQFGRKIAEFVDGLKRSGGLLGDNATLPRGSVSRRSTYF